LETNEGIVTVYISSSCSAPQTESYNLGLSKRRIEATVRFFQENEFTKKFMKPNEERLIVKEDPGTGQERAGALGERARSTPQKTNKTEKPYIGSFKSNETTFDCSDSSPSAVGGDTPVGAK
jgi:hypothetical protein